MNKYLFDVTLYRYWEGSPLQMEKITMESQAETVAGGILHLVALLQPSLVENKKFTEMKITLIRSGDAYR
jgi:hypothetical protein